MYPAHSKFEIQSSRLEELFVSYIMTHMKKRAAVIVPEGFLYNSSKSLFSLRKEIAEKYLVGVISLPKGVFLPYTGVKTSILILDKSPKKEDVFYFTICNDGFSLDNYRNPIDGSDIPYILKCIKDGTESTIKRNMAFARRGRDCE